MAKTEEKLGERIIPINNEGKDFLIYFDGTTYYDEDYYGNKIEKENSLILDEDLNTWCLNVAKGDAKATAARVSKENGIKTMIGPKSPETEVVKEVKEETGKIIFKEVMVPNTRDEVGIWKVSTEKEKQKYRALLDKQARQSKSTRLAMKISKIEQ